MATKKASTRPPAPGGRKRRAQSTASPRFSTYPISLQQAQRERLLEILGRTSADGDSLGIVDRVERVLGAYQGFKQNVEGAPRAGLYKQAYLEVAQDAAALANRLMSMNAYISDQLDARFAKAASLVADSKLDDLVTELLRLHGTASVLAKEYEGKDAGGRGKQEALTAVICGLRKIFHERYRGPAAKREKKGAFERLAPQEKRELSFVAELLTFANVPLYRHQLPLLFRDVRCIPRSRRTEAVESIAKKVNRQRAAGKKKPQQK